MERKSGEEFILAAKSCLTHAFNPETAILSMKCF